MSGLRRFFRRLMTLGRHAHAEDELTREIEAHLRLLEDGFIARGMSAEEARRAARRAFGGVEQAKERQRDARSFQSLQDLGKDLAYAVRLLGRTPGVSASAIATLALGIGASTALFSVAYGAAIRPLPYPDPHRLIRIYEAHPGEGKMRHDVSIGAFHGWREGAPSIQSIALFSKPTSRVLAESDGVPLRTMSVSPSFFTVLGVPLLHGPGFRSEHEYTRFTATDEAVISFGAWQRLFGGRHDVIGQFVEVTGVGDNDTWRIVGVTPEHFAFAEEVDLWQPAHVVEVPVTRLLRLWRYERAVARLRPDATLERTRAELEAVSAQLAGEFPTTNSGWTATVQPLHDAVVGSFGRATWLLMAAVVVVMLVACVNVSSLLLGRAIAKHRETAVRVALGAGVWRVGRLWIAEASALVLIGTSLGLLVAYLGVSALRSLAPPGIPRVEEMAIDLPVLAVTVCAAVAAVAMCGLVPLVAVWRRDVASELKGGTAVRAPRHVLLRHTLTVGQCAGAVVLIVLAFMFTRSLEKLLSTDLGWDGRGVVTLRVSPPMPRELRRPWARYVEWSDRTIARLEQTPGIEHAAITNQVPLSPWFHAATLASGRGKAAGDATRWPAIRHVVSDGYFESMRIRLSAGRLFDSADRFTDRELIGGGTPREHGVAVVSESVARTLWPGRVAVGQALWLPDIDNVGWREVVGVVGDIQFHAIGERAGLHVFIPWTQFPTGGPRLVVRGTASTAETISLVRNVVSAVEPGTQVDQVTAFDTLVADVTAQPRFTSRVVALFGGLAMLLAAVGLYGIVSYSVRTSLHEIGVRMVLGASGRQIQVHTLRRGVVPALIGCAIGVGAAFVVAGVFQSLFYEVSATDPGSYVRSVFVLLIVASLAALGPARRAGRVDPASTLRADH